MKTGFSQSHAVISMLRVGIGKDSEVRRKRRANKFILK
jgi:hypothetical protein